MRSMEINSAIPRIPPESNTDAVPGSGAEGNVVEGAASSHRVGQKAVRIKVGMSGIHLSIG